MIDPHSLWDKAKHYLEQKRPQAALPFLVQLAKAAPGDPVVHFNLGTCLCQCGRGAEAIPHLTQVLKLVPSFPGAARLLGDCLARGGRTADAIRVLQTALRYSPSDQAARLHLATLFRASNKDDEAVEVLRAAPDQTEIVTKLLMQSLVALERPLDAIGVAEKARSRGIEGKNLDFLQAAAEILAGRTVSAASRFASLAAVVPPDDLVQHSCLMAQLYRDDLSADIVAGQHLAWGQRMSPLARVRRKRTAREGRPLRLGYLSSGLCRHAVASFFLGILEGHDPERFDVYCYANVNKPDEVTDRMRRLVPNWRTVVGLDDDEAARLIARDRIDILIDLNGHSDGSRLGVMARRPAPLQGTWLGYPATTGLCTVDFIVGDEVVFPRGEDALGLHSESPLRLGCGYHRFTPFFESPPAPPPSDEAPFTFCSFNTLSKLSSATVALWSAVLRAVPGSRLLLKRKALSDGALQDEIRARFVCEGVDGERIVFAGQSALMGDHLSSYAAVDVALDCVPYNGTTTTCDALWMGVPVVALYGDRQCARVSASLLNQIGRRDWIAESEEGFVDICRRLAAAGHRTVQASAELRERIVSSPLGAGNQVVRELESALSAFWNTAMS